MEDQCKHKETLELETCLHERLQEYGPWRLYAICQECGAALFWSLDSGSWEKIEVEAEPA